MQCFSCCTDHDRSAFPAPDAVIPICGECLQLLATGSRVNCSQCGRATKVSRGGVCASCATDGRKVKGLSHATDKQAVQIKPDS